VSNIQLGHNDCTLIVSSCDNYSDLWRPFFALKERFWKDCSFRTILISETKDFSHDQVTTFLSGPNGSWSSNLRKAIEHANTPYIILMLEDFFLRSSVENDQVMDLYKHMILRDINMLRLIPRPGPNVELNYDLNIGKVSTDARYRASTQAAFWKSSVLLDLIIEDENIWSFEANGTIRSKLNVNFYSVIKPVLTYKHHVVERGKWFPWEAWKFARLQIGVDLKSRKVMTFKESFYWLLIKSTGLVWLKFPKKLRKSIKFFFNQFK
jgi:hypothetical protein